MGFNSGFKGLTKVTESKQRTTQAWLFQCAALPDRHLSPARAPCTACTAGWKDHPHSTVTGKTTQTPNSVERFWKTNREYWPRNVCMSLCSHRKSRHLPKGFSRDFAFRIFIRTQFDNTFRFYLKFDKHSFNS